MFAQFLGNLTISEDCLFLNIWSPSVSNQTHFKPVMFWIHGGELVYGSSFQSQYNASALATHEVVVVSVNYRLGALGFMYADDESVPGNMGFYDQLLALKWVRENIHLFGGDKNQITIFGESAGSWSVSAQVISPLSNGLFRRAIMQSGALLFSKGGLIMTKQEAINGAKQLAKRLNCTDDKQWLQCLRRVDVKKLVMADTNLPFPVDGTQFLPLSAQKTFSDHKFNKDLDVMAGVTRDEGSMLAMAQLPSLFNKTVTEEDFTQFIAIVNKSMFHNLNATKILHYYFKDVNQNNSDAIKWKIFEFYGHLLMQCPTYLFAKQYAECSSVRTNVFFYELTYTSRGAAHEKQFGVDHGSDLDFVFGLPLLKPKNYTKQDFELSKQVMIFWTNFAKYGIPGSGSWPRLLNEQHDNNHTHHTTTTRVLHPGAAISLYGDFLKFACDQFWADYFLLNEG